MPIKFQISKTIYIEPTNERIKLTPAQKFIRLSNRLSAKGSNFMLREFHFQLIESEGNITLFNGDGIDFGKFLFSVEGIRQARVLALNLFLKAENQNGGFLFTAPNIETMNFLEIEKAKLQVRSNLEYKPFKLCDFCKFDFEFEAELNSHLCAPTWAILER
jgi:hypothetical protein